MLDAKTYPDAVLVPSGWKGKDPSPLVKFHTIMDRIEAILGVDRSKGERAHVRDCGRANDENALHFCTKDVHDTILFPTQHPREGQQRYNWKDQPDGSVHGFLVEKPSTPEAEHAIA